MTHSFWITFAILLGIVLTGLAAIFAFALLCTWVQATFGLWWALGVFITCLIVPVVALMSWDLSK